jgi:hypothetical protein
MGALSSARFRRIVLTQETDYDNFAAMVNEAPP